MKPGMPDIGRILYVAVVIGPPLLYVVVRTARTKRFVPLVAVLVAGSVIGAFPVQTLPVVWASLFALMAVTLVVLFIHVVLTVPLLFHPTTPHESEGSAAWPSISVLIPARNESRVLAPTIDAVLRADYPSQKLQILIIDDASTDGTNQIAAAYAGSHANVSVMVRPVQSARGKAASLNDALIGLETEFVCVLDADHQLATNFFQIALTHFANPLVGCVQVITVGRNWSANLLTRLVEFEFLGWQYCFLESKSNAGLVTPCLGSGAIFRTKALQSIGGFDSEIATEDVDAALRLYESGYRIVFETRTHTTNELVSDLSSFQRQRYRWARGTTQAISKGWPAFYRTQKTTLRQKVDFLFYPLLLTLMVAPYLQLATHAGAIASDVRLEFAPFIPISYVAVGFLCYLVAGLRARRDGTMYGSGNALILPLMSAAMCVYYATLVMTASLQAFIDQFIVRDTYRARKAEHYGPTQRAATRNTSEPGYGMQHRLLVGMGRPQPDPQILQHLDAHDDDLDWERLCRLARIHGVGAMLDANLVRARAHVAVPPDTRHQLAQHRRAVLARNLQLLHSWALVRESFEGAGVDVIPMKGISFIERLYPPDVRPLYDVDLLVRRSHVRAAGDRLKRLNFMPVCNPTIGGKTWCTQQAFRNPETDVAVDLHWDLINIFTYRRVHRYRVDELWSRANPRDGLRCVYQMAPEDEVIHNSLHCAIHHNFAKLVHFVDLSELIKTTAGSLDWDLVHRLARAYRVRNPVYSALWLTRRLLDAPIPDATLKALEPYPLRRLVIERTLGRRSLLDAPSRLQPGALRRWWSLAWLTLADSPSDSMRSVVPNLGYAFSRKGLEELSLP
jgi:cellulose synthase/poly-beta-1,6-N-acetylglucosamine synthase-like glycosyltransferase